MRILNTTLLCCLILFFQLTSRGQAYNQSRLDSLSVHWMHLLKANEEEKAYLVSNKSIYTAGEDLWFRAFLLRMVSEKISVRSKVLFVDLVNDKDVVISRTLLNSGNQQTEGRLGIPDTLESGYYWLRAYTQHMTHSNGELAAILPLYIVHAGQPLPPLTTHGHKLSGKEPDVKLDIFPEGGHLITGVMSTIAFYLHDEEGHPLSLPLTIKDNRDSVAATCTTTDFGVAKASFLPDGFRKYKAVVMYKDKEHDFTLPPFNRFAGQIAVTHRNENSLSLRVVLEDSIYKKDVATYVLAFSRDSLCYASIGQGSYEAPVSLQNFPDGIATFFLFDKNFHFLSERSIYVRKGNPATTVSLDNSTYSKRSKALLTVQVRGGGNMPVPVSLAVDVTDSTAMIPLSAANIMYNRLKGAFNNWNLARLSLSNDELDLLALSAPSYYGKISEETTVSHETTEDDIFFIKGTLFNAKGVFLPGRQLQLISKTDNGFFMSDTTDEKGRFSFGLSGYVDSSQFILQMPHTSGKTADSKIVIDPPGLPELHTPEGMKQLLAITPALRSAYAKHYTDTVFIVNSREWMRPVTLRAKSKTSYDHSRQISRFTTVLTSEQLLKLGMGNIGFGLLRLPGVQIINGYVTFYGPDNLDQGATQNSEPIILLDGIQIALPPATGNAQFSSPVMQYLNSLNPREIDFIEVIKGPEASIYGVRGGTGVIYIHSSADIRVEDFSKEGVYSFYRPGFAREAVFPETTYHPKSKESQIETDSRSTLMWYPNDLPDDRGKANYTFYTNDVGGTFRVTVSGITVHGDVVYQTVSFVVR